LNAVRQSRRGVSDALRARFDVFDFSLNAGELISQFIKVG
jgi:hypothetical protein